MTDTEAEENNNVIPQEKNGSNNTRAFGGVVALVAIIAGVYAMIEPMTQRIDFMERHLDVMSERMDTDDQREREDNSRVSIMGQKFTEVETQFSDMERRIVDLEQWQTRWNENMPCKNAKQDEKIFRLEQIMFGRGKQ